MGASCIVVPPGQWSDVLAFLVQQFARIDTSIWQQRLAQGLVSDGNGANLRADSPCFHGQRIYYFREVEAETVIPFDAQVLYQDAEIVVADKPHFLPVTPSGKYVQQTLLVRLKDQLGLPDLSPIHRIDRDTAGLVLFSVRPQTRGAYTALFRERQVRKVYECIAPWNPNLNWPLRRESRIGDAQHFMQQSEEAGDVNAITDIAVLEVRGPLARYELKPLTGQRHQLRVHMNALGLPILNDGIYPTLLPEGDFDYAQPLQLLARELAFDDPVTGHLRAFSSRQALQPWELPCA